MVTLIFKLDLLSWISYKLEVRSRDLMRFQDKHFWPEYSRRPMRSGGSSWVTVNKALWVRRGGMLSLCCRPGPEPRALCPGSIPSSKACGPFTNFNTTWEVVPKMVSTFPSSLQSLVHGVTSEAFAVPFFMILWWVRTTWVLRVFSTVAGGLLSAGKWSSPAPLDMVPNLSEPHFSISKMSK